tara:strand:- start:618 stop:797 length:180 start_codon:yes stop_codon:yes gene_type:complete
MDKKVSPLKIQIVRKGIKQIDVAAKTGIAESVLSKILNGRIEGSKEQMADIKLAIAELS